MCSEEGWRKIETLFLRTNRSLCELHRLSSFPTILSYNMSFVPSFPTYDAFLAGLCESLSTEFYGETYPDYQRECDEFGDVDADYIKHFLASGLDPQEGLSKMIDCLCEGSRYAKEYGVVKCHIQPFLDAGAKLFPLTAKVLYIPEIKSMYEFEDAVCCNGLDIRGIILDTFWQHLDHDYVQSITDWSAVKPKYWEFIPGALPSRDVEPEKIPMAFYRYYKFLSDYLRGEHLRFVGSKCEEGEREYARQQFSEKMMSEDDDNESI